MGEPLASGSKRVSRTIDSFFAKKPKKNTDDENSAANITNENAAANITNETASENINTAEVPEVPACSTTAHENTFLASSDTDIGYHIDSQNLEDFTKAKLLEHHWTPPVNYDFPHNIVRKKGKNTKKYAQKSHLDRFHWLVLSHKDRGLYCKYCAIFAKETAGKGSNAPLKRLVKTPLTAFDDLLGEKGALSIHEKNQYHKNAVEAGKSFLISYHNPSVEIINQLSSQRAKQIDENRQRLKPIIKTIILCGQQNIALRGHRDSGSIFKNNESLTNDGNFRALLRFHVDAGDKVLEEHLKTSTSNATYISKRTQNEIIDLCKEEIQETIINNVKKAKYFAVIFDETTDISTTEQLSLSLRYLHNNIVREDFITFCDAYKEIRQEDLSNNDERRLTGIALAHIVIDLCEKYGLDLTNCVGIGTDSCSVMSSELKGAVNELIKTANHAKRCPCNNHILNNSLAKSLKVTSCRNASATMKKLVAFANASAKRSKIFTDALGGKLESLCDTRWVERHDGYLQFQGDTFVKICDALTIIATWQDNKSSSEANCLRHALCSSEFIISSICLADVLGVTVSLSRFLQKTSIDLKKATDALTDTIAVLVNKRRDADSNFKNLFAEAQDLANKLNIDIKAPQTVSRQTQRSNIPGGSDEEYFRRSIYLPLLDNIILDINDRLPPDTLNLFGLGIFMPKPDVSDQFTEDDLKIVKNTADFYRKFLGVPSSTVISQYKLWMAKWERKIKSNCKLPESVTLALEDCDIDMFPNIHTLLKILATLPISAATAERSFSTLRRLKTWLRANITEERLTGLALMNVHPEITPNVDSIITRFSKRNRRLEFTL